MMEESSFIRLINLRKTAYGLVQHTRGQQKDQNEEELKSLKKNNESLQKKIKKTEELLSKNINANRYELEIREKEIFKLHQEIKNKEHEKQKALEEIESLKNLVNLMRNEKEEIFQAHSKEISDLNLKHDQEIYILKKMKKNN